MAYSFSCMELHFPYKGVSFPYKECRLPYKGVHCKKFVVLQRMGGIHNRLRVLLSPENNNVQIPGEILAPCFRRQYYPISAYFQNATIDYLRNSQHLLSLSVAF